MYIYRMIIKNFRNLENLDWKPNKDINIIFGPNGSGKSNIALALDLLFNSNMNDDTFDITDFYNCDINNEIKIECWIEEEDTMETQLSQYIQHIDSNDNLVSDDNTEAFKGILILRLSSDGYLKKWNVIQSTEITELKTSLRKSINYTFLSSDRKADKVINLSKSGLFYKNTRKNVELWGKLASVGSNIVKNANDNISNDNELKTLLNEEFKDNNSFFNDISIGVKEVPSTYYQSGYQFMIMKGNYSLPIEKHSTGQQNLFLFDLIIKSLDENSISYIEEIEQNLEPINQKRLAMRLRDKIQGQLFITSHSISLLEYFDLTKMFLLNQGNIIKILDDSVKDEKSFEINVMKGNKRDFLSALMASGVLLCEGPTEYSALPIYDEKYNNKLLNNSVEIVKVDGKKKFDLYLNIFKKCKKKTYVLIDKDEDISNDIKNIKNLTNKILIQSDDYESVIFEDIATNVNDLDKLVPFIQVKDYLGSCLKENGKKEKFKPRITEEELENINSYNELHKYRFDFIHILHKYFVSPYYARFVANVVTMNKVPTQYKNLFDCIVSDKELKKYEEYDNVYLLGESC